MKRIILLLTVSLFLACSEDEAGCEAAREQIMAQYEDALNDDSLTETRRSQIKAERDRKIQEACD